MQRRRFLQSMALTVVAGTVSRDAVPRAPVRVAPGPIHPLAPIEILLTGEAPTAAGLRVVDPSGRGHETDLTPLTPHQPAAAVELPLPLHDASAGRYGVQLIWRSAAAASTRTSHLGTFELRPYQFC
jgi:hypothetical protein